MSGDACGSRVPGATAARCYSRPIDADHLAVMKGL
jgi:hypothetical protein